MVFFSDFLVLENFASRCRFKGWVALWLSVGGRPGQLPGSGPVDPNGTLFELPLEPLRGKPLLGKKHYFLSGGQCQKNRREGSSQENGLQQPAGQPGNKGQPEQVA